MWVNVIQDETFQKQFNPKQSNFQRRRLFMELFAPGIICLNEPCVKQEDLFWGYYTNHEGFSIEFNTNELLQEYKTAQFVKVEYTDLAKEIKGSFKNGVFDYIRWARFKKRIWKHEQEWRFVFHFDECNGYHPIFRMGDITNRQKEYDINAIKKVTLGFRFFGEQIHKQRKTELTDNIIAFDFLPEDNSNKWHILSTIYKEGIELFQVEMTENFDLIKTEIQILEVSKSRVLIYYTNKSS